MTLLDFLNGDEGLTRSLMSFLPIQTHHTLRSTCRYFYMYGGTSRPSFPIPVKEIDVFIILILANDVSHRMVVNKQPSREEGRYVWSGSGNLVDNTLGELVEDYQIVDDYLVVSDIYYVSYGDLRNSFERRGIFPIILTVTMLCGFEGRSFEIDIFDKLNWTAYELFNLREGGVHLEGERFYILYPYEEGHIKYYPSVSPSRRLFEITRDYEWDETRNVWVGDILV